MSATWQRVLWATLSVAVAVLVARVVLMRPTDGQGDAAGSHAEASDLPRPGEHLDDALAGVQGTAEAQAQIDAARPMVIAWRESWAVARKEAAARNQLVLLYAGIDPRTCPPCRYLETEFFVDPVLEPLNRWCVPLYLPTEGTTRELTPADRALVDRLDLTVLPVLVLLTPEGGVIHRQAAGLYAVYNLDRRIVSGAPEGLLTPARLLEIVKQRIAAARVTDERIRKLQRTPGPAAAFELTELLAAREEYEAAIEVAERSQAETPSLEMKARLAALMHRAGRRAAAERAYFELVRDQADHPLQLDWRLRHVLLRLEAAQENDDTGPAAEALLAAQLVEIAEHAAGQRRFATEASARAALAEIERRNDNEQALRRQLAWFAETYLATQPDEHGVLSSTVRLQVAELALGAGRLDEAVAHLERLQAEHPTSEEAQMIKHGLLAMWRSEMERQKPRRGS